MSSEVLLRALFTFIISAVLIYSIYSKDENERKSINEMGKQQRYVPLVPTYMYLLFLIVVFILSTVYIGLGSTMKQILMLCFDVFLQIGLYYSLLLLLMPWIRKKISARVCAALWMIPNLLYYLHMGYMELNKPTFILYTEIQKINLFIQIWMIGFLFVLGWKWIEHFLFRSKLLKKAYPVENEEILAIWKSELAFAGMGKRKFKLVFSSYTKTPLTIGFWQRTIKVILPEKQYTSQEYHLIFKHEIVHIGREDALSKFFMTFCTAVCWFNPLVWLATKECATDMELSCDETVLLEADEKTKEKYAELILETAADDRGFSTCLSANAKSLRYRLKNIIQPRKTYLGAIFAGIVTFVLFMSCGNVALAYPVGSVNELVFEKDRSQYQIDFINSGDMAHLDYYQCQDEEQLFNYLSTIKLYQITGNYSYSTYEHMMRICIHYPDGNFVLSITDNTLKITPLYGEKLFSTTYQFKEEIDWDKINSLIVQEKKEENYPYPPEMALYFNEEVNPDGNLMVSVGNLLSKQVENDEIQVELERSKSPNLISGFDVEEVKFYFSHELYTGEYLVEVRKWDEDEVEHISSLDFEEENVLKLKPYSAHYRVYGLFTEDGRVVYEMEYLFDVELPQ